MREAIDIIERAQRDGERFVEQAVLAELKLVPKGESAEFCAWCGAGIPPARRKARPGCDLCVDCQAQRERLAGRGA